MFMSLRNLKGVFLGTSSKSEVSLQRHSRKLPSRMIAAITYVTTLGTNCMMHMWWEEQAQELSCKRGKKHRLFGTRESANLLCLPSPLCEDEGRGHAKRFSSMNDD